MDCKKLVQYRAVASHIVACETNGRNGASLSFFSFFFTEAEHREIGRSEKYQKSSSEYPEEEVPSGRKKNDIYFLCRSKNRWYSVVDVTYLASADPAAVRARRGEFTPRFQASGPFFQCGCKRIVRTAQPEKNSYELSFFRDNSQQMLGNIYCLQ